MVGSGGRSSSGERGEGRWRSEPCTGPCEEENVYGSRGETYSVLCGCLVLCYSEYTVNIFCDVVIQCICDKVKKII